MQPVITGLPAWPTTIFSCTPKPERQTVDADTLQGCPGQDACLTTEVLISRSQLQQYQAVQEAALEGPASPIEAYSCNQHILDAVQDSQQGCHV